MQSKDKPYVLFVAEVIYLEISEIKKRNSNFSNKEAIDAFIGNEAIFLYSLTRTSCLLSLLATAQIYVFLASTVSISFKE